LEVGPQWPKDADLVRWLTCTAVWAMRIQPGNDGSYYARLALERLLELGHNNDARKVAKAMVHARTDANAFAHASETKHLIPHLLALDEKALATSVLVQFFRASLRQPRKSDREFGIASTFEMLLANGVKEVGQPSDYRLEKKRIEHLERILSDSACILQRPPAKVFVASNNKGPNEKTILVDAKSALAQLTPSEWNVHFPLTTLHLCVMRLVRIGARKAAEDLLESASRKFASGDLDGRGFASGGAYISLAEISRVLGYAERALSFVDKAAQVCSKIEDRRLMEGALAKAYFDIGQVENALTLTKQIHEKEIRDSLRIEFLFRLSRLKSPRTSKTKAYEKELTAILGRLTEPKVAAACGWNIVHKIERSALCAPAIVSHPTEPACGRQKARRVSK
jgi:hypothetical protein